MAWRGSEPRVRGGEAGYPRGGRQNAILDFVAALRALNRAAADIVESPR